VNVLFDLNVLIDVACRWQRFPESLTLYRQIIASPTDHGALAACGYTTLYYIITQILSDARTRAMLASVKAEAWARSGDAKKAKETLNLYDAEDATYEQIKPQLYRALAYAAAYDSDLNTMRRALRKLLAVDARLLGGFMMKKTHPLLQKEAKKMLEQSGQVPKKMIVQRRV